MSSVGIAKNGIHILILVHMARFPWSKTIATFFHALSLKVPISPHPYQPKHYQVFSSLQI